MGMARLYHLAGLGSRRLPKRGLAVKVLKAHV